MFPDVKNPFTGITGEGALILLEKLVKKVAKSQEPFTVARIAIAEVLMEDIRGINAGSEPPVRTPLTTVRVEQHSAHWLQPLSLFGRTQEEEDAALGGSFYEDIVDEVMETENHEGDSEWEGSDCGFDNWIPEHTLTALNTPLDKDSYSSGWEVEEVFDDPGYLSGMPFPDALPHALASENHYPLF